MAHFEIKHSLKQSVYLSLSLLFKCAGIPYFRRVWTRSSNLTVLMYHKINDIPQNPNSVSTSLFEKQLQHLQKNYQIIDVDTVLDCIGNKQPFPENAVLLTFDDGYKDNLTEAYPLLKKYGFKALLFIPTDYPGIKSLPHDEKVPSSNPTLTWEEIKALDGVFEIGSHGCSHTILTTLPIEKAREEIVRSKELLQKKLGCAIRTFSYPKGTLAAFDSALENEVRKAGYELCFTSIPMRNAESFDPFCISRYNVENFGLTYFKLILDGSTDILRLKETRLGFRLKQFVNTLLGTTSK